MKKIAAALLLIPTALFVASCSRPPEQQLLTQFFRASRARDNATTARMSAVEIDPREQGSIDGFSITSISEERREPLDFKALLDAEVKAKADEDAFLQTKIEYQAANIKAIEEVLKLERDPDVKMSPAQAKVKAEWDTWREQINAHQRDVSQARASLRAAMGPAEASLTQPGLPQLDPATFEGAMLLKDVIVTAKLKTPEGQELDKTLTITFARASGTLAGTAREGRPIIVKIDGL